MSNFHKDLRGLDLHSPSNELVENNSGSTIFAFRAVKLSGIGTVYPEIQLADGSSNNVFGITTQDIQSGSSGVVCSIGVLSNVNTGSFSVNDKLYAGASGVISTTVNGLPIGIVLKSNLTTGQVYVKSSGLLSSDITGLLGYTPENVANKSNNTSLGTSNTLYPTQNAVKSYVDTAVAGVVIPDATTLVKGIVKLAGDLSGTADLPTVPGLATKEPTITAGTTYQYYRGDKTFQTLDKNAVGLSNIDNTSDVNKPVSTAQAAADAAVQAFSIQRANHTGTQSASTITGLATVATSGAFDDLSSRPVSSNGQFLTGIEPAIVALTDAATITTDVTSGNVFTVTIAGNRTLAAPTGMGTTRQRITYVIRQDAIGGRTLTFDPVFNFGLDLIGMSLSSTPNATDYIGCIYNPTTLSWDVVAFLRGY